MLTLSYLRNGAKSLGTAETGQSGIKFWLKSTLDPNQLEFTAETKPISKYKPVQIVEDPGKVFDDQNTIKLHFLLHAYTLSESVGLTDVDCWLNYIKTARCAKIFDIPHFQYVTDHLLNIPKFKIGSNERVLLFDENKAKIIIPELIRLVRISLDRLFDEQKKLNMPLRTLIVARAVNISVILTRFISRLDYEFKDLARDWALLMAELYNVIEPFSHFNSSIFGLTDLDVSRLNLALSHMCYARLAEQETFTNSIELGFACPYRRHRKTLAKFHWFMAKTNYIVSVSDPSIANDQFKYEFRGSPLAPEEIKFLEAILKEKFWKNWLRKEIDVAFDYHPAGYVVEMTSLNGPNIKLLINLATGEVFENGVLIVGKSQFYNSFKFEEFFSLADREYLIINSKAFVFAGVQVLVLPTLKGVDYLMIKFDRIYWILREWNNNWYVQLNNLNCGYYFKALNYNWPNSKQSIFMKYKRSTDPQDEDELIIFDEESTEPVVKITNVENLQYKVSVPGRTDDINAVVYETDGLEMHLKEFAKDGIVFGYQILDDSNIIVYNGHRLPQDPTKPFVLTTSEFNPKWMVRNVPNMEICEDQRIGKGGLSLPGSLVASNDGKKVLLLSFAEIPKTSIDAYPSSRKYITIESIPMSQSSDSPFANPDPQSRKHKLLLAYYMISAQNYDTARELLHPSTTSIHQNEAFSQEELEVFSWILRIKFEDPEFTALKLVCACHLRINDKKFAFESDRATLPEIKNLQKIFTSYLMSIREVSEKYNIFKIFPDILAEGSILSKMFFSKIQMTPSEMHVKPSENFEFPQDSLPGYKLRIASRYGLGNLIYLMKKEASSVMEHELMKYLAIKSISSAKLDRSPEMAIYCYLEEPHIWNEFLDHYNRYQHDISSNYESFDSTFSLAMQQCWDKYHTRFEPTILAEFSDLTSIKDFQTAMRQALGISDVSESNKKLAIQIVSSNEKALLIGFRKKLINHIKNTRENNHVDFGFDSALVSSNTVLESLYSSVHSFIIKKGLSRLSSFDFGYDDKLLAVIQKLHIHLINRIHELEAKQTALTEALMELAYPQVENRPLSNIIESLFSMMHRRKEKTFSDLYACYLRNSLPCIQKKFPQLSLADCQQIKDNVALFYNEQILIDYFKVLRKTTDTFVADKQYLTAEGLLFLCDELNKISDFNTRLQDPIIMNFEFKSKKYRLKADQVKDIELLTSVGPDNNFNSVVIQRMMAAGKTLVLGTVSVVMKALKGNDRLSILVPPSSLYQSNTTAMQSRTYQYFKKKGDTFNFPRLPFSPDQNTASKIVEFLDNIINMINRTITEKRYLILSPDHLQSFLNSYIEAIDCAHKNSLSNIEILKRFATIYQIFKEKSSIILDEIDMTMDPKKELNFPTMEKENYNMTAVAMLSDIVEFMMFDESIKEAGLDIFSNNQAALTSENYVICRRIVLDYIESQMKDENSLWRKFVPEIESKKALEFLRSEDITEGKAWVLGLSTKERKLADALIIVKVQLYHYLKGLLGGTVNQNYGSAGPQRPEIKFAVPYLAANTPSAGSYFADRWETLIKTLLMISASPCSRETAKKVMQFSRKILTKESSGVSGLEIRTLPTFVAMSLVLSEKMDPLALNENDENHIEIVHKGLVRRSPAAIRILFVYYINEVFANMEFPVEQITSNALHMASMFGSVQGYSGTIDNVNILPQSVVKAAAVDHDKNEIDNGGIALKLIQDCNGAYVPELSDEIFALSAIGMIQQLFALYEAAPQFSINQVSAIIDTGAFFKNFTNVQVANAILVYFKGRIEAVLYYDERSNQLNFIRGTFESGIVVSLTTGLLETTDPDDILKATHVEINERFTFYDQRHISGTDILQPKSAHAIMTADPRVLLRGILQGALRMRQFMTTQKVHCVISESLRKFYNSKINEDKERITVSDLLTLGALNEAEKQEHENERLAFGKIDAEIRAFILDEISEKLMSSDETGRLSRVMNLFADSRNLFIRSIREDPLTWLLRQESQNAKDILIRHAKSRLLELKPFFESKELRPRYAALTKKIGSMIGSLLKFLEEDIIVSTNRAIGTEILIQNHVEIESLTLVELEMDQLIQSLFLGGPDKSCAYNLVDQCEAFFKEQAVKFSDDEVYSLKHIYENQRGCDKSLVEGILLSGGDRIGVTANLVQIFEEVKNFPIFSKWTIEGSHLLVYAPQPRDRQSEPKVLLISPKHAAKVYEEIEYRKRKNAMTPSYFWLCDLAGNVVISNDESSAGNIFDVKKFESIVERLIFDLLIFNGSLPQILGTPKLKLIYEEEWLAHENFKVRAMFLRLRLKVLSDKDVFIFDDDEEYAKLVQFSLGNRRIDSKTLRHDGYPKVNLNLDVQSKNTDEGLADIDFIGNDWNIKLADLFQTDPRNV